MLFKDLTDGRSVNPGIFKALYRSFLSIPVLALCISWIHFVQDGSNFNKNRSIVYYSDPPVISGISVSPITAGSAVINWTTDVPANSQIIYGATTAYGSSTLVDSTLALSHSLILYGLAPGKLYHYKILSADINETLAIATDNTFSTASLSASLGTLNTHTVSAYPAGKIVPWTSNPADGYDTVIYLAWSYLLNSVPNDPATGKPAYYSQSFLDPNTQAMANWPHNPAGLYAMLTESALKYYHYSGNAAVMQIAKDVAIWHLDHGMTLVTDNWPGVPYASGDAASLTYDGANLGNSSGVGDGDGYIEPDKIGELGNAWLQLYKYDGNIRFRDAAIQAANVLSSKVRTGSVNQSPWPFRVNAHTGIVREEYSSDVIAPVSLLDGLIAAGIGDTAAYRAARTTAWNWMMTYPMQNNAWAQYFEDVGIQSSYNSNLNQYNAMMTARYLLEHPEFDPNWETHVRGLITWVETEFGETSFGTMAINEQKSFFFFMGSHTSRYASINALLYEKTGDLAAREKAYRAFNWATYMARSTGVVIDGPEVNHEWFTDGYGDYVRHFVTGMAAVPEWSPANQTHLLRSSSLVKSISYGTTSVNYTTYDGNATDILHVNFNPSVVTADGIILPHRSDLSQSGWTLDIATKTLKIYHTGATQISISAAPSVKAICPASDTYFVLEKPGSGYSYQWQIDSTGNDFVDLLSDAIHSGVNTDTLRLHTPPTSCYGFKYRCIASKSGTYFFGATYVVKFEVTWQGNVSTAWENTANWNCNYIPDGFTDVIIPGGSVNDPVINMNAAVHSIIISSGGVLTVNSGIRLDIKGK
ncbi:MAG: fibronectin type III domain-containing protein [Chitinophagaceae bacterium]|nr:fibronectin type III domain-containing protein [Chitinophagaceae bacterium]